MLNDKFESVPIVLGCRRLIGRHAASTITRYIKYELNRVGITSEQITSITTDNGSDVKKSNWLLCLCLWKEPNEKE